MGLMERIRELGDIYGIDYIGAAEITGYRKEIAETGGRVSDEFPRAVSVGIVLPSAVVDRLGGNAEYEDIINYSEHAYHIINSRLDQFSSIIASLLQREGHKAMPIPAAKRIDANRVCASVSHKLIARLSGFGWIGKSCLFITPEHGPRVRWTTVFTDAPLEVNDDIMDVRCGSCSLCVNNCPAQAISGRNYADNESREMRFDVSKCIEYLENRRKTAGLNVCGMCLYICPYGNHGQKAYSDPVIG